MLNLFSRGSIRVAVTVVFSFCCFVSFAQRNRLSISPSVSVPIGELSWSYAPGIGAKLNYSAIKKKKKSKSGSWRAQGISLGYTVFQPLADTLYYVVDHGGQGATGNGAGIGTAVYSPFKMFRIDGTKDWGIPLGKKIYFTPGFHIGVVYAKRKMSFKDSFGAEDGIDEFVMWGAFIPQAGLEYKVSDHLSTTLSVAYTFILQAGSTSPDAMNYNENTGLFYHYYSPGISLNYYF